MDNKNFNNIFFITDKMETYEEFFKKESNSFNYYSFFFDELINKNFHKNINPEETENNLVIIHKSFYDDLIKDNKIKLLTTNLDLNNIHFLFIDEIDCNQEELGNIIKKDNFFYKINTNYVKEYPSSIYFLLILIFQHLKGLTRLNDYIINSFQTIVNTELIIQQKNKIAELYKELETLSKIDILTNVLNRRAFFEVLDKEITRTFRDIWRIKNFQNIYFQDNQSIQKNINEVNNIYNNNPKGNFFDHYGKLSCLMIDIDDFKDINDNYGHLTGDAVLKKLGNLLISQNIFRDNDIIGRFGGEEFIIILPETNAEYSKIPADRFREEIKKIKFNNDKKEFSITISIGISELYQTDKSSDDIIERADKALYYAKKNGKDQVVVFEKIPNNN